MSKQFFTPARPAHHPYNTRSTPPTPEKLPKEPDFFDEIEVDRHDDGSIADREESTSPVTWTTTASDRAFAVRRLFTGIPPRNAQTKDQADLETEQKSLTPLHYSDDEDADVPKPQAEITVLNRKRSFDESQDEGETSSDTDLQKKARLLDDNDDDEIPTSPVPQPGGGFRIPLPLVMSGPVFNFVQRLDPSPGFVEFENRLRVVESGNLLFHTKVGMRKDAESDELGHDLRVFSISPAPEGTNNNTIIEHDDCSRYEIICPKLTFNPLFTSGVLRNVPSPSGVWASHLYVVGYDLITRIYGLYCWAGSRLSPWVRVGLHGFPNDLEIIACGWGPSSCVTLVDHNFCVWTWSTVVSFSMTAGSPLLSEVFKNEFSDSNSKYKALVFDGHSWIAMVEEKRFVFVEYNLGLTGWVRVDTLYRDEVHPSKWSSAHASHQGSILFMPELQDGLMSTSHWIEDVGSKVGEALVTLHQIRDHNLPDPPPVVVESQPLDDSDSCSDSDSDFDDIGHGSTPKSRFPMDSPLDSSTWCSIL
jgi:hypothetical protein